LVWDAVFDKGWRLMGKKRKPKDLKLQMVWTQVQDAHGRALASNAKGEEHFNGFITPEGEISAVHDTGKVFSMLVKLWGRKYEIAPFLRYLAEKCTDSGHFTAAYDYLGKVLFLVDAPIEKEGCLLGMGQVMERSGDYEAAREAYLGAFELPQDPGEVWYLLDNNLGYCLNQAGQCQEAERYCRAAIMRIRTWELLNRARDSMPMPQRASCLARNYALPTLAPWLIWKTSLPSHPEILEEVPDLQAQLREGQEEVQQTTEGVVDPQPAAPVMDCKPSDPTCSRCVGPLKNHVCWKCNLVHCPFRGSPENPGCTHLLADWSGILGNSDRFHHSPFTDVELPFMTVEYDSRMIIDSETALGRLSPLLGAYGGDVWEPPNPVRLFQAMVTMISKPCTWVTRRAPGMAGIGG
jgi:hypothetical protein